jgi:hypothetical protein
MLRAARGWLACLEEPDRAGEYEAAQALSRSLPCQRQNAGSGSSQYSQFAVLKCAYGRAGAPDHDRLELVVDVRVVRLEELGGPIELRRDGRDVVGLLMSFNFAIFLLLFDFCLVFFLFSMSFLP